MSLQDREGWLDYSDHVLRHSYYAYSDTAQGALFAVYGAGVLLISLFRRQQGNRQFFSEIGDNGLNQKRFRTSGNVVVVLTALSVAAYATLLVLTLRLPA